MVQEPATLPVTTHAELMVAIAVSLLFHVPPVVVLLSVVVAPPAHTVLDPVIGFGTGGAFTVNRSVALFVHPLALGNVV